MLRIALANRQSLLAVDRDRLKGVVREILADAGITAGRISLAIVDDATIHALNRQFLEHDYPTDVLSFTYDATPGHLNGEVVASAETAIRVAGELAWNPADELLLYIVHGTLHLVGLDDTTPDAAAEMRRREREVLARWGVSPPPGDSRR